ncbi:hypothetical protein BJ912DRAFT_925591 [Pholiota molesta]|nr:hypothetical protein BJ912DRAFT_925591 [Pholiota molesta]
MPTTRKEPPEVIGKAMSTTDSISLTAVWEFQSRPCKAADVLDDDIWLSEGGGMDPDRTEYNEFLRAATEQFTKAPCESTFRAIMNALMGSKSCDRTGKASIACARHGCYAPNALVDLFKGEQQKNVDFAFWKALETTGVDPQQGVILMYDIACQYCVHLEKRLEGKLPRGLIIDRAIGLFHAANYFRDISTAAGLQAVTLWTAEVVDAESKRLEKPEVMDIYAARIAGLNENMSAPVPVTGDANVIEWLEFAITVEEKQLEIQYLNRQHGADIEKIQKLRHALTPLVATLNELQLVAGVFQTRHQSGHEMNDSLSNWDNLDNGTASDSASSSPAEGEDGDGNPVESVELCIPLNGNVPDTYANVELQIRKNQAMTDLNLIRDLVADMSFRWTEDVRKGSRKEVRTRGRAALKDREKALSLRCQIYTRCRSRLVALGADPQTLQQFRVLTKADTKCSTAVLTPNMPGSTTVKLSWIWHSVTQRVGTGDELPADPATQLELSQFGGFIGCGPEPSTSGGGRNAHWSDMKWSGRCGTSFSKAKAGLKLLKIVVGRRLLVQLHMHTASRPHGDSWP